MSSLPPHRLAAGGRVSLIGNAGFSHAIQQVVHGRQLQFGRQPPGAASQGQQGVLGNQVPLVGDGCLEAPHRFQSIALVDHTNRRTQTEIVAEVVG